MFETRDVVVNGLIAGLLAGGAVFIFPWARSQLRSAVVAVATFLGFIAWNLVISHANATGLDVDSQFFDLSWQDVGSGVLAFAATALALGAIWRKEAAGRVVLTAGTAGLVAVIYDIFVL
jgi:hypothetical protein